MIEEISELSEQTPYDVVAYCKGKIREISSWLFFHLFSLIGG